MPGNCLLTFDEQVYCIEAVQKAAYRYMNSFTVDLSVNSGQIHCEFFPSQEISESALEQAILDFKKEVLDQQLRLKIKAETESVRNLILGIAFSRTGLQESE